MTEEHITETRDTDGATVTRHTIVNNDQPRRGPGWIAVVILGLVAIAGVIFFTRASDAELAKDNAVAEAANEVGEAANKAGDAVQDVADKIAE